jgi:hypothetical protein
MAGIALVTGGASGWRWCASSPAWAFTALLASRDPDKGPGGDRCARRPGPGGGRTVNGPETVQGLAAEHRALLGHGADP